MAISRRMMMSFAMAAACTPGISFAQTAKGKLLGAGGNTIRPIMTRWTEAQAKTLGLEITYQAIGSPLGTSKILAGEVDFAVLEIPLTDEQLGEANLFQFPLAFASIVFVVNIPGVATNQLALTGQLLGAIYWGKIKKWNDPKIVAANPGLALPDLDISPVHHAVPGGATFGDTLGVTSYLLAANADWQAKFGNTLPKRWCVGSMTATGETMTETIRSLEGSIGYLPLGAAARAKLSIVSKRDASGKSVVAGPESLTAAVQAIDWAKTPNLVGKMVDLPGDNVWPIVIASYGVVPKNARKVSNPGGVKAFFKFILTEGAPLSRAGGGEPPPAPVQSRVLSQMDKASA